MIADTNLMGNFYLYQPKCCQLPPGYVIMARHRKVPTNKLVISNTHNTSYDGLIKDEKNFIKFGFLSFYFFSFWSFKYKAFLPT